jgi:DUF2950 family protein
MKLPRSFLCLAPALAAAFLLVACVESPPSSSAPAPVVDNGPAPSQRTFDTPEEATQALLAATKAKDQAAIHEIFGSEVDELLSGDAEQDAIESQNFAAKLAERCYLVHVSDDKIVLNIGAENWPMPVPLVEKDGKWYFDTLAGKEEILNRRIGKDELTAIGVCRAYVVAQRQYASEDRNGDGVLDYAQKLMSTPGKRDGLYWDPVEGEALSPFGPLVANAREEGYHHNPNGPRQPFQGYLFDILTEQGPDAPGGAYDYIINGHMIAGFALVAYPDHWGESGIMTFIVNQAGKVYECNLGENSAELGAAMKVFNPDEKWTPVETDQMTQ